MKLDDNFLEAIGMQRMSEADQLKMLTQLAQRADAESRKEALEDPLARAQEDVHLAIQPL